MSRLFHLLTLLVISLLAPIAHAQEDDWLNQVQQINRDLVSKEDPDARLLLRIQSNLANHQDNPHHIVLKANRHYTIFADCDRNCNRLNLTLLHNGKVLQRTDTQHAFPILSWHSNQDGRYILRVKMQECSKADCLYSISIFEGTEKVF